MSNLKYAENKKITGNYDKTLAVKCVNGTFVGKKSDDVISYKGIPFVDKQPVGEFRWKAPTDFVADNGIYEAYHYGKAPCQTSGDIAAEYGTGEDCLYLNIWKTDDGIKNKPVMVWIYGGAFEVGGATDPQYDCHDLVKENSEVIFVTINYRLSLFGFLHLSHLPDGKNYSDAQNLGLMDQIAALKWIKENIANFGGDPNNVTIWGESAGAGSCTLLPLVKGSHKYFKRVIAQSGTPTQTRSSEQAIACTDKLMNFLGCKTVADLMKISAEEITNAWEKLFGFYQVLGIRTFPERDGNYLPLDTWQAYADGAAKDIEFLHGCNKDEFNTFLGVIGEDSWKAWAPNRKVEKMSQLTDAERSLVESYCNDVKDNEPICSLFSQILFIAPQIRLAEEQAKAGGKSYTYYFTVESSAPLIKSGHAIELPTVFNHSEQNDFAGRDFDKTFSKTMRKMWIQFAKTGNPSLSADISPDGKAKVWLPYDIENKNVMVLDEFNIHLEKESALKIVDWDRTYFLTKYYSI